MRIGVVATAATLIFGLGSEPVMLRSLLTLPSIAIPGFSNSKASIILLISTGLVVASI